MGGVGAAPGHDLTVIVRAPDHHYREAPVHLMVTPPKSAPDVALFSENAAVPVQTRAVGGKVEVTWIVRDLPQGESRSYTLRFVKRDSDRSAHDMPTHGVTVEKSGENLDIRIDKELFTRYDTTTGPNKPYFYPLNASGGKPITRHYPLEQVAGETHDHPHHRGLWFTHGAVNGEDYWSEEPTAARTVHRGYAEILSGPVYGYFRADTDWISKEGKKIAEDVREVTIYPVAEGRLMDFTVTIRAVDAPLIFGDTKEGSLGIRLADSMRMQGGGGHIETATGLKDGDAWGQRADWVDYYGPVGGETLGLAIFDHASNLRHPTYWHVRDYGLFAANPFGIHDFTKRTPAHAGDYTLPAGQTMTFRYRLFIHRGATADAHIADVWNAYSDPPKVEAR